MDNELVNRVVNDVLASLGQTPKGAAAQGASARPGATATSRRSSSANDPEAPSPGRMKRVFVTAQMLRVRVKGAEGAKSVELAWNEVLTPNALDFVQQMRLEVKKIARPVPEPESAAADSAKTQAIAPRGESSEVAVVRAKTQASSSDRGGSQANAADLPKTHANDETAESRSDLPIGLVVSRPDGKVSSVLASLERDGIVVVPFAQTDCPVRNLAALCEAIGAGQVSRGVVIAPHAAGTMALAGKCRGVRPVQATRAASVEAGLRQFAANLLVVEHAFSTFHEIRAMVRLFAAGPKGTPSDRALMEAIGDR